MFANEKKPTVLEHVIEELIIELDTVTGDSDEYTAMVQNLSTLHKMLPEKRSPWPSPDTILTVVGSIVSVIIIIKFEEFHALTSKGLGFVLKPRA